MISPGNAQKPKISVVIPTCDRPLEYILEAVESVQSQSLKPFEVFLVDNGLESVNVEDLPKGVQLCRIAPRVGASRARNFGAAMACGEYLSFLDDDDLWDSAFLEEAFSALQVGPISCVYGRIDKYKNGQLASYKIPDSSLLTEKNLLKKNSFTGGINFLISKELFWRAGGFGVCLEISKVDWYIECAWHWHRNFYQNY